MWTARILTLFPEMFPGPLGISLAGKAIKNGLWSLETLDIRDFARDKHRTVDDTPAGGGPGMVMRADVLARAIDAAADRLPDGAEPQGSDSWPLIYLSPRGRVMDQGLVRELATAQGVTLLCGRYEGIDERVLDARPVMEVSLGDFVLSGGEIAAMALIDAAVRLLPGVLGEPATLNEESFEGDLLEYPQYTRPPTFEGREIPEVLLSGHHQQIAAWRRAEAERLTRERRPDLWQRHQARVKPAGRDKRN
ncbi:MAG: tRNA (guanosine(37)-N1)-methyltransferase TrmD [Sphingomonadales bacterium]